MSVIATEDQVMKEEIIDITGNIQWENEVTAVISLSNSTTSDSSPRNPSVERVTDFDPNRPSTFESHGPAPGNEDEDEEEDDDEDDEDDDEEEEEKEVNVRRPVRRPVPLVPEYANRRIFVCAYTVTREIPEGLRQKPGAPAWHNDLELLARVMEQVEGSKKRLMADKRMAEKLAAKLKEEEDEEDDVGENVFKTPSRRRGRQPIGGSGEKKSIMTPPAKRGRGEGPVIVVEPTEEYLDQILHCAILYNKGVATADFVLKFCRRHLADARFAEDLELLEKINIEGCELYEMIYCDDIYKGEMISAEARKVLRSRFF